ncbi:methionine gamma-lyase [Priestia flexa]
MANTEKYKFETKAVHGKYESSMHHDSLATPLYQTSTFTFSSLNQGARRFAGEESGYVYSRLANPTVAEFESRMAELEEGEEALAFSSGMAAVSAALIGLTKAGDHILCSKGLYGCTFSLLELLNEKYGITHSFSTFLTVEEIKASITDKTACIYIETPINPTMQVIDLTLLVSVAKEHGVPVIVDNTFLTPYLQKPLTLGCDLVIHSATKYIGGHGDVVAGVMVGEASLIQSIRKTVQKDIGGILAPFDAWLLIRGLKTLPVRVDRHCENAEKIVEKLKIHPKVKTVYYPEIKGRLEKQMERSGGVLAFELNGSEESVKEFMNELSLISIAVSLGDTETLIQHPASMTHAVVPEGIRKEMGISNKLLRLSVGLEFWEDIWKDLENALDKIS